MSSTARILIVDDDESIRDFVDMALTDEGYEVLAASHGEAALDIVGRLQPDLILLDMRMPGMDGSEFSRAYRELPGPHAPVIVLTAARDAAEGASRIEADGFLAKPFDLDKLLELVSLHTRKSS